MVNPTTLYAAYLLAKRGISLYKGAKRIYKAKSKRKRRKMQYNQNIGWGSK